MALARRFDYDEFLKGYRAACERHGIDPVRGANSYQVVHLVVEARRAAYQADCWWRNHDLWLNSPPYRSETEREAIFSLFAQAYALIARLFAQVVRLQRAQMSLRDLHQHQHQNHQNQQHQQQRRNERDGPNDPNDWNERPGRAARNEG